MVKSWYTCNEADTLYLAVYRTLSAAFAVDDSELGDPKLDFWLPAEVVVVVLDFCLTEELLLPRPGCGDSLCIVETLLRTENLLIKVDRLLGKKRNYRNDIAEIYSNQGV